LGPAPVEPRTPALLESIAGRKCPPGPLLLAPPPGPAPCAGARQNAALPPALDRSRPRTRSDGRCCPGPTALRTSLDCRHRPRPLDRALPPAGEQCPDTTPVPGDKPPHC